MAHERGWFFGTVLAVVCGLLLAFAASAVRDSPVIDRRDIKCSTTLTTAQLQEVPGARNIYDVLKVAPQVNLRTDVNSKGKPTQFYFGNDDWNIKGRVNWFKSVDCSYGANLNKVLFPNGATGKVRFSVHSEPNPRVHFQPTDVWLNGQRLATEGFMYVPVGASAGQPPPEDLPVRPPDQPVPSVPTDVIFRGPNGLQVGNGSLFNVNLSVLDHGQNHEGHSVVYNGRRYHMCQFQNNQSTLRAFDTSADRFSIEKTTPPNLGWEWRPFQCDPTGCRGEGTYFGQPIRAWTPEPPQISPGGQSFDGRLNIQLYNDTVPYRFAGRVEYGSTQTTVPYPSVPIIPVPAPQPTGYQIPAGGPLILDAFKFGVSSKALDHSLEECRRHTFTVGGVSYQVCRVGEGSSVWEAYGARPDGFRVRGLNTTRQNVQWQDGECGPDGCRFQGMIYGQPAEKFVYPPRSAWTSSGVQTEEEVKLYPGQPNESRTRFRLDIRSMF